MNLGISLNNLIIPLLTGACAVLVVLLQRKTEKIKIIESQLSQSKYKSYSELVTIFYDLFKDIKSNTKTKEISLKNKLLDSKKDLLIYGSDAVFKKYVEWLSYTSKNPDNANHVKIFLDLLILIRKDMGQKETILTRKDIMLSIMQDESEYEKIKDIVE